ncbi:serine hydrolase domain-containing protein [Actinokineospora sp. NBRC 105648]|uniref:serine hydrolase domain-containing protein n=1 Tax=Actinokineospora sp. NBRC 105648 TaxID=3032206 RepID=UPI0024A4B46A|nr:serine hydrolase domain-containing protein [Actinokineospora sp. NBRC 105648]GLZ41051.1 serine hydrolase [Actinokineospora sp. NBRC 105648]
MRKGTTIGLVAVLAASLAVGVAAPAAAERGSRIDRRVVQAALDKLVTDGAAGVQVRVTDGRDRFTARAGVAELGTNRPVPLDGRFRAGSITKVLTSTVVLQLVGEGKVGLDTAVSAYLPGLLRDGDRITVRQLLQHTSGLYNYTDALPLEPDEFEAIRYRHWQPREFVDIANAHPPVFAPGTAYEYSNTNYIVAGLLIERVTRQSYERAVEQRVLRPLGLRDTSVPDRALDIQGPHAHGYTALAGRPNDITRLSPSIAGSAGALVSTTADLDRVIDALLDGRLLAPAQLAEMTKVLPFTNGYGLGLAVTPSPCGVETWGHPGGIAGYASVVLSTRDTHTRLEVSVTTAPTPGQFAGLSELLNEVFCPA